MNPFTFRERTYPNPQPQALGTIFEARVRDYMASHTERIERFESAIFKQREEINGRMTEMFKLLNELTTSKAPKKVLIREEAKSPITKSVNCISLIRENEEKSDMHDIAPDDDSKETAGLDMKVSVKEAKTNNEAESEAKNKQIKDPEKEEAVETPSSRPVEYYLKHRINEKLIEGLVDNKRGPVYEAILKKKITKKEDIVDIFEILADRRGLKLWNVLVDQGSDVNVMPYSTYMKLTDESPAKIGIRLSLASHSYIYPLGIAEDVLVEIVEHVYPMDFVILDIKEDEKRPFILGTPFLTTAKAMIKFDKGTITLRSRKSKISFHRIPESPGAIERGVKNNIKPIAPTVTVNRLVLEWEERIRLHQEREIELASPSGGGLILYQAYGNLYAMTGRKAHLLEDKQIPSVGVFDEVFSIWKAFGGNTRDLGSFGEETDKTTDLHQHLSRISTQQLETASQITRDAVTTHLKMASQDLQTTLEWNVWRSGLSIAEISLQSSAWR
ncbi:MAK10-like protein [Tanacetum coccineum]